MICPDEFCIPVRLENGDGVLTNLYDDEGIPTDYPPRAVIGVGMYITGPDEGLWFTVDVSDAQWEQIGRKH